MHKAFIGFDSEIIANVEFQRVCKDADGGKFEEFDKVTDWNVVCDPQSGVWGIRVDSVTIDGVIEFLKYLQNRLHTGFA